MLRGCLRVCVRACVDVSPVTPVVSDVMLDISQTRHEDGIREEPNELTTLFLKISVEMDIASNRLRAAESCLVRVSPTNT